MAKRNGKRRAWTSEHVRTLKALARKKTPAGKIARSLKRTEGASGGDAKTGTFKDHSGRRFGRLVRA
jgi:hypothetical protein